MIRDHMDALGFLEVETPLLTRSTPEGARDFLVPSRLQPGEFYALPQSPQQLKQLLMVAGQDRYYQIVRCLRDENPRADRGFEFTQLDVEMSFVDEEDIVAVIEPLYARIVAGAPGCRGRRAVPAHDLRRDDARYGSDKPDLRYGMELVDLDRPVRRQRVQRLRGRGRPSGGSIKALAAPGGGRLSRKELDKLVEDTKGRGAAGLVWIVVEDGGVVRSPVEKFLSAEELDGHRGARRERDRATWSASSPTSPDRVNVALDGLRRDLAARLDLIPEDRWAFCWMTRAAAVRMERGGGTMDVDAPSLHRARSPTTWNRRTRRPVPTT